MKHKLEQVRALKEILAQLPPVEAPVAEMTIVEVVKLLRPEVVSLQRKGYSFEMIAAVLAQHGFSTTASTLKKYRNARKPSSRKGGKRSQPEPTVPAPRTQDAPQPAARKVLRPPAKAHPHAPRNGAFIPLEDTPDI